MSTLTLAVLVMLFAAAVTGCFAAALVGLTSHALLLAGCAVYFVVVAVYR